MRKILVYETIREIPSIRFFNDIKIEVDFPFSEIVFEKKDFETASQVVSLQFLGGYNDIEDRTVFLNNEEININDLII